MIPPMLIHPASSDNSFSLTIPVSGLFVLTAAGDTLANYALTGRGTDGGAGTVSMPGYGGCGGGCAFTTTQRSVLSGDTLSLNMAVTSGNYSYLTKGASYLLNAGIGDAGNSGTWADGTNIAGVPGAYGAGGGGGGSGAGTTISFGGDGTAGGAVLGGAGATGAGSGGDIGVAGKSATVAGCGGGGGGKGAGNPAGGAGFGGKLVISGTTTGTGFNCPKLIRKITNSGGFALVETHGPHGKTTSPTLTISGTSVPGYNVTGNISSFPTTSTALTDIVFSSALGAGNTAANTVGVGSVEFATEE